MKLKENISTRLTNNIKKLHNYVFGGTNRFNRIVLWAIFALAFISLVNFVISF